MSDMEIDEDKENYMHGYHCDKSSGVMQDINSINDVLSISSDSVNDSNDSDKDDKNEINIKAELKGDNNEKFKKVTEEFKNQDRMFFINYFTCRTQRVQLKPDTEALGKKNFGDLLSKTGAQIIANDESRHNKSKTSHKVTNARSSPGRMKLKGKDGASRNLINDSSSREGFDLLDKADNPDLIGEEDNENKDKDSYLKIFNDEKFQRDFINFIGSEVREEMMFMLETGLNLLIYGIGSKINFMKWFATFLTNHPILAVNGYHPGITLKSMLKELTAFINTNYVKKAPILKQISKFFSMHENIDYLLKMCSIESLGIPKIYIVIISLDGGNLKSLELQRHLSVLARCDKFGIIATTDTLKPGAFWDDSMLDKYNFVFYEINTYEEFHLEKSLTTPLFSMKNEREELGLSYVLKSFTEYQVAVIRIIAKFQLDNPHEPGIKEKELYEECVEHTVLSDIKTLKELLREVRDHKILFEREDKEGNTFMYLKLKSNILEKIINNQLNRDD